MEETILDISQDVEAPVILEKKTRTSKEETFIAAKERGIDNQSEPIVSCLTNKKLLVRYVPKQSGIITNPKHIFYGGMGEGSKRVFTVPKLNSTRTYLNVLTNSEKTFLEQYMGLEYNDLSVYNKKNNFWSGYKVTLTKSDIYLDLSNPEDYIKYKVLLANKDYIAPSLAELQDRPKATYQFVLINEEDRLDPFKLLEIIEKENINRIYMPFVALNGLCEASVKKQKFPPSQNYKSPQ